MLPTWQIVYVFACLIPAGKFDRAVLVILFGIGLSLLVGTIRGVLTSPG